MRAEDEWKPEVVKTFRSIHTGPIAIMKVKSGQDQFTGVLVFLSFILFSIFIFL